MVAQQTETKALETTTEDPRTERTPMEMAADHPTMTLEGLETVVVQDLQMVEAEACQLAILPKAIAMFHRATVGASLPVAMVGLRMAIVAALRSVITGTPPTMAGGVEGRRLATQATPTATMEKVREAAVATARMLLEAEPRPVDQVEPAPRVVESLLHPQALLRKPSRHPKLWELRTTCSRCSSARYFWQLLFSCLGLELLVDLTRG